MNGTSAEPRPSAPRQRDEAGQLAGVELLPFGFLVFVLGVLFFGQIWAIVGAKSSTESAAREAARTFVESSGDEGRAAADATAAANTALANGGRLTERATVSPKTPLLLERCARSTWEVSYQVPLIAVPLLPGFGGGVTVRSSHSEVVDPFRDGLEGEAGCV